MQPTELHLQSEDTCTSLGLVRPTQTQIKLHSAAEAANTYLGLKMFLSLILLFYNKIYKVCVVLC
jgi:hypothetical protein